jgi:hypothetical protein
MTATQILYPSTAAGSGLGGKPSAWSSTSNATGAPNGVVAANNDTTLGGQQQLLLGGYNAQQAILAANSGQVPYSVDYLQVQVTFSITDSATNYVDAEVLLLDAAGTPFARESLYLLNSGDGLTVEGDVNFIDHANYGNGPLTWADLAGVQIAVQVTRSGAAGVDTFSVDAVGLIVVYTASEPTDPAATASAASTGVTLRIYDRTGNRVGLLPWSTLTRTIVRNAPGALTATVPRSLLNWDALPEESYLRVAVNGVEAPDWYLLDDDGDDDADDGGEARPVTLAASGVAEVLTWGLVYSWQYQPVTEADLANAVIRAQHKASESTRKVVDAEQKLMLLTKQRAATATINAQRVTVMDAKKALDEDKQAAEHAAQMQLAGPTSALLGLDPTHGFADKTPGFMLNELLTQAQARGCFPSLTYSFTPTSTPPARAGRPPTRAPTTSASTCRRCSPGWAIPGGSTGR